MCNLHGTLQGTQNSTYLYSIEKLTVQVLTKINNRGACMCVSIMHGEGKDTAENANGACPMLYTKNGYNN